MVWERLEAQDSTRSRRDWTEIVVQVPCDVGISSADEHGHHPAAQLIEGPGYGRTVNRAVEKKAFVPAVGAIVIVRGIVETVEPEQLGALAFQIGVDVYGDSLVPGKVPVVEAEVYGSPL